MSHFLKKIKSCVNNILYIERIFSDFRKKNGKYIFFIAPAQRLTPKGNSGTIAQSLALAIFCPRAQEAVAVTFSCYGLKIIKLCAIIEVGKLICGVVAI